MIKKINSLQTKLTASFIFLIVVISGGTFFYTFTETKNALKDTMRDELKAVASVVATQIDGDSLYSIKPGDEASPKFVAIRDQLKAMRNADQDIKYVYTMRKIGDKVKFIVDADFGNEKDPGGSIDEDYEPTEMLLKGFSNPCAETQFSLDKWGTLLSGYAPIKNSSGSIIGLVGVDMTIERVLQKQDFIGNTIYLIIGVAILIAGVIIALFSLTIIRDIKKLNNSATQISMGNTEIVVDINRKDEIGELANSFSRMVASLKFMMLDKDDSN